MKIAVTTAREMVRHVLFKTGAFSLLTRLRTWRGGSADHLQATTLKARFSTIYDTGVWTHGKDAVPGSGEGSTAEATAKFRAALPALLNELGAKSILDIGCGDFFWMQHVTIDQDYIGIDVVDSVIDRNIERFAAPGRTFKTGDATVDDLPESDVVLCREVLFHLSFDDIRKLLKNVLSKNRAYLILTSDRQSAFNSDIPTGDFRLLNLEARPLKFPPPLRMIDDSVVSPGRYIGVWDARELGAFRNYTKLRRA